MKNCTDILARVGLMCNCCSTRAVKIARQSSGRGSHLLKPTSQGEAGMASQLDSCHLHSFSSSHPCHPQTKNFLGAMMGTGFCCLGQMGVDGKVRTNWKMHKQSESIMWFSASGPASLLHSASIRFSRVQFRPVLGMIVSVVLCFKPGPWCRPGGCSDLI